MTSVWESLLRLLQGELVAPDSLEQKYGMLKLVDQTFIQRKSFHSTVRTVVVPYVPATEAWGDAHGLNTLESIAAAPNNTKERLTQLAEIEVKARLKNHERNRKISLSTNCTCEETKYLALSLSFSFEQPKDSLDQLV